MINSLHKHATNWGQLRAFPCHCHGAQLSVSLDDRQLGQGVGVVGEGGTDQGHLCKDIGLICGPTAIASTIVRPLTWRRETDQEMNAAGVLGELMQTGQVLGKFQKYFGWESGGQEVWVPETACEQQCGQTDPLGHRSQSIQAGEPEERLDRIYGESQSLPLQQKLIKLLLIYRDCEGRMCY